MRFTLLFTGLVFSGLCFSQTPQDIEGVKQIYDEALTRGKSFSMLNELCTKIGARLSGSPGAAAAVEWSRHLMETYGFDSVWLQPVIVPHWVRGQQEIARIINSKKAGTFNLSVCALGGSVGTGPSGVSAQVIEVKNFDELKELGAKGVQGKIIFFNRPMDPTRINTGAAYGGAVDQRGNGAIEAAKLGAVAVIVRSMGLNPEDYPHTGAVNYADDVKKIPAIAVSTKHADLLSRHLKEEKELQVYIETHCELLADAPSYNVIGQINGGEYKDEIIDVGGHLDSWDLAQGAHDDGAGCVQSMEALRLFKELGIKPKRTLRAVMFMNEENGLRGALKYAEIAKTKNENHIAAIESDAGGFSPRGFTINATDAVKEKIRKWKSVFEPYEVYSFNKPGGGADIGPLGASGTALIGLIPDSQRYFDYHHTPEDTIDKVSPRELELGAATMAALIFMIDRHGLK